MTERFEVGEVAIVAMSVYPERIGRECVILGALDFHVTKVPPDEFWGHKIQVEGVDHPTYSPVSWLRKKKPPSRECDQLTSWDKCEWRPMVEA